MFKISLILMSYFLAGCMSICIPKCDKKSPCRSDIITYQYELSSILEENRNETTIDENN